MTVAEPIARTTLAEQIQAARKRTESYFRRCVRRICTSGPIRERHRVIFYVGHLDAFDYIQSAGKVFGSDQRRRRLITCSRRESTRIPKSAERHSPGLAVTRSSGEM